MGFGSSDGFLDCGFDREGAGAGAADDDQATNLQVGGEVFDVTVVGQLAVDRDYLLEQGALRLVHPLGRSGRGRVGGGVPVPAPVGGLVKRPVRGQPASARGADQQAGQRVPARRPVGRCADRGDLLRCRELGVADQRGWVSS